MRPRSAETLEPACTKRKMLSMKRSTSRVLLICGRYSASGKTSRSDAKTRTRRLWSSAHKPVRNGIFLELPGVMTPPSDISSHKSLPSRVRSPTPAKTERPPCFMATLWINSRIKTVLPTPAPPNRSNLAALDVWPHQVNDLDAGLKHFESGGLFIQFRRWPVNREIRFSVDWTELVHRLAENIHHAAECLRGRPAL